MSFAALSHVVQEKGQSQQFRAGRLVEQGCEALAGLRPGLIDDVGKLPGARILDGRFSAVQQAIGTPRTRPETAAAFLAEFVEDAKSSGLVARLIARHGVEGRLMAAAAG